MENIIDELNWRGLIKDYSDQALIRDLFSTPNTIYCGFDPSAKSMHIGNFVMIAILMRLQKAGHRVIAVVGGGTGMIGDPSGKSKERNLLDDESIKANTESIRAQLGRFIDLKDPKKGILVNNYDWLSKLSMIDYLRDYGKFFPINYMLAKDIVASRLEAGISYTEFSYMILQSIDFLHLHKTYGCNVQIGGSDQWGNLTSGLELIRKVEGNETKVGVMTSHLITKSDGKKFGKSEDGALFLDRKLTSPYKLYQYFINTSDEDAIKYLKVFTFLTREEIEAIAVAHSANPGDRLAQKRLAFEIVRVVHGEEAAERAIKMTEALFAGDIRALSEDELQDTLGSLKKEVEGDSPLIDLLVSIGAASSKREAREFITGNSVMINGEKVNDVNFVVEKKNALYDRFSVIRRGKKNYFLVDHR